ncbi:hypothetical protein [Cetobacterium sp. SF1]|uniref:hypothetical protein n=1 Tax=Cetobacterium sp. SF1 TaxID=3417654 RepID=UPI003CF072C6
MKTVTEVKVALGELLVTLKNGLKRQVAYEKELATDRETLVALQAKKAAGDTIPTDCPFPTWDAWIEEINRQIKSGEGSLARIEVDKCEITAFEYYIANATETPPSA